MNIINSNGLHVGMVTGAAIFDLGGQKIYELKESTSIGCPANWSDI